MFYGKTITQYYHTFLINMKKSLCSECTPTHTHKLVSDKSRWNRIDDIPSSFYGYNELMDNLLIKNVMLTSVTLSGFTRCVSKTRNVYVLYTSDDVLEFSYSFGRREYDHWSSRLAYMNYRNNEIFTPNTEVTDFCRKR